MKRVRRVAIRVVGRVCGGWRRGVKVERMICGDEVSVRCFVWARRVGIFEFREGNARGLDGSQKVRVLRRRAVIKDRITRRYSVSWTPVEEGTE